MPNLYARNFLTLGHETMDQQHQELFDLVHALYAGMREAPAARSVLLASTIEALCEHVRSHFADEERVMAEINYPDITRHRQLHDAVIGRIEQFEARLRGSDNEIGIELLSFLVTDWIGTHIGIEDRKYADYIDRHVRRQNYEDWITVDGFGALSQQNVANRDTSGPETRLRHAIPQGAGA